MALFHCESVVGTCSISVFHYQFCLFDLRITCNAFVRQRPCWEHWECFPSFMAEISLLPKQLLLCVCRCCSGYVCSSKCSKAREKALASPLPFGSQQTPGSSADGCLLARLHCLGMVCKCQNPFSYSRGSPVTSHPSQSLPLPHIQGPSHLIPDSLPANPGLHIYTQRITTSIAIPVFHFES